LLPPFNVAKVIVFWQRGESCRGEHKRSESYSALYCYTKRVQIFKYYLFDKLVIKSLVEFFLF
jgi:hypothetical protein